jgi:hypothetical protein
MEKIKVVDYYDHEPTAWDSGLRETPIDLYFEFEPYSGFSIVKGYNFTCGEYTLTAKCPYSDETFDFVYEEWWGTSLQEWFEDSVDSYLNKNKMSQMKLNLQGENHD